MVAVKAALERGRGTCGPERLQEELAKVDGIGIGRDKLRRVRRKLGLKCKQVKKFKATTNSNHTLPVSGNTSKSSMIGKDGRRDLSIFHPLHLVINTKNNRGRLDLHMVSIIDSRPHQYKGEKS